MRFILIILSVAWVAIGTAIILYTRQTRSFLREYVLGTNIKLWALCALAVGLVLVLGAFLIKELFWVVLVLGLLAMVKGIYLALGPPAQIRSLLDWWFDRASEATIRLWGMLAFTLGLVLFVLLV